MSVTTAELNLQISLISQLREQERLLSEQKKKLTKKLDEAEGKMLEMLAKSELTSYRSQDGLCSVSYRLSVQTPKTPEDCAKFFEYLKSKGLYEAMITVHSKTLNSFYRAEFENAKTLGLDNFEIPGLTEVSTVPILSFRKS